MKLGWLLLGKRYCRVCGISLKAHSLEGLRRCHSESLVSQSIADQRERAMLEEKLEDVR